MFLFNAVLHRIIDVFFRPEVDCELWRPDIGLESGPVIVENGFIFDCANF